MPADIAPVTRSRVAEALVWMSQLYEHEGIPFDEPRARRAVEGLIESPERGGMWLIEVEGAVVGYMAITVCYSLEFGGPFGLLDELFVSDASRGQGLGAQALEFAATWCRRRGLEALRLEVGRENARGQAFYRRFGFELQERYLMTRWL